MVVVLGMKRIMPSKVVFLRKNVALGFVCDSILLIIITNSWKVHREDIARAEPSLRGVNFEMVVVGKVMIT